ncbi:MAG: hexitol phosphatase HxpB [Chitinophagaceae bacterium]|nr:hexitol phosphatase HxpB [Chitinophagaceae bacterium]
MDGLLIDSEPLWQEAANDFFSHKGLLLTTEQYEKSTGLRTAEFLEYWYSYFNLEKNDIVEAEHLIVDSVIHKVKLKGQILSGVTEIIHFFKERNFKIGLASSSPTNLIQVVVELLNIEKDIHVISSAQELEYGKPHPQVYLNCAQELNTNSEDCLCFEDSLNGLIAAKAAKMKCVIIPASNQKNNAKWSIADLQLNSLLEFSEGHLNNLIKI